MPDRSSSTLNSTETITAIEPLQRDPNLRAVRVNGKRVATLRAQEVESVGLVVGQTWDDSTMASVEQCLNLRKAREKSLRYLGTRSYGTTELRNKLIEREVEPAVADTVVSELVEQGWLDDRSHAEQVAESCLRSGPMSVGVLAQRVQQKGVDSALAAEVAQELLSDRSHTIGEACAYARKRLVRDGATDRSNAGRVARWLARRGFEEDDIREVLSHLGLKDDEFDS